MKRTFRMTEDRLGDSGACWRSRSQVARRLTLALLLFLPSLAAEPVRLPTPEGAPDGWSVASPREALALDAQFDSERQTFQLRSPDRAGLNAYWEKTYPVQGGHWIRFEAWRKATNIAVPRRSCVVRLDWYDDDGKSVTSPHPVNPAYFGKETSPAVAEFPEDGPPSEDGWVPVVGEYWVPDSATRAVVQLHLRWAPGGRVQYRDVRLEVLSQPTPRRTARLAAVHHDLRDGDGSVEGNRRAFVPLIEQAAEAGADLIVLPELLTCKGVTKDYPSVAEPVPGPTTDFFARLAKRHDCYLVGTLPELEDHLVYNTAFLVGPEGDLVGKYRKVTLPREEIRSGLAPGSEYPVFETRFGKVGLMVCYDVFFPEVARRLSEKGAEVIALPIWGGNPRLAAARCAENGIYLVTSTYTHHDHDWMRTAIWNREGERLVEAREWGHVVVSEVELSSPQYWSFLGDFRSRIAREGPVREGEGKAEGKAAFGQ